MDVERRLTRQESQQQTRERLIEAAERVFVRDGFEGSSVEAIAAEAGYTRGAFYSNFESKDELFLKLLERRSRAMLDELSRIFEAHREAEERFAMTREFYAGQCRASTWAILRAEFQMRALHSPAVREHLAEFHRLELGAYTAHVTRYFAEAGLLPEEHCGSVALALMQVAQGLAFSLATDPDPELEQGAAECGALVFDRLLRHARPADLNPARKARG
jgi:AcrR family transcriptional regulator